MIDLTGQDVAEFRALFREQTGRDLSDDEARAYARSLVRLVEIAARPDPAPPPG